MHERIIDLFEKFYPNYSGEDSLFESHVRDSLRDVSVVLDAGCGSGSMAGHDFRQKDRLVVGVDVGHDIKENPTLTQGVCGRLELLPFKDRSVDLILCRYVLEHIEEPWATFGEFRRVLRDNGKIVVLTPNLWHYVTCISRIAPWWFHRWFNTSNGISEKDTFKTFYRANTRRRIARLAREAGLRVGRVEMIETSPNYLEFSRLCYRFGVGYERVVNRLPLLKWARVNMVATLVKSKI